MDFDYSVYNVLATGGRFNVSWRRVFYKYARENLLISVTNEKKCDKRKKRFVTNEKNMLVIKSHQKANFPTAKRNIETDESSGVRRERCYNSFSQRVFQKSHLKNKPHFYGEKNLLVDSTEWTPPSGRCRPRIRRISKQYRV